MLICSKRCFYHPFFNVVPSGVEASFNQLLWSVIIYLSVYVMRLLQSLLLTHSCLSRRAHRVSWPVLLETWVIPQLHNTVQWLTTENGMLVPSRIWTWDLSNLNLKYQCLRPLSHHGWMISTSLTEGICHRVKNLLNENNQINKQTKELKQILILMGSKPTFVKYLVGV